MDWKTISNNVLLVGLFVGMVTLFNQVNNRLDSMQTESNRRFDIMQAEMNRRFGTMQAENNRRFDEMQAEMDRRFGTMQAEMNQLRTEMNQLRTEMNQLRTEVIEMRTEMNRPFDTMQTENQRQHDEIKDVLRVFEGRITRLEEKAGIGPEAAE